jgi:uncharacterized membrane protein YvbJ
MNVKRASLAMALCFVMIGCGLFNTGPEATVKKFYKAVENGDLDDAMELLSNKVKSLGKDKVRAGLAEVTREMKSKGGVKNVEVVKMDVTGDTADGQVKIEFGDKSSKTDAVKLIKEEGKWRLDADK